MITSQTRPIQALVNDVHDKKLLLPELQRGYVWKAIQVRDLFDSLYHKYPSGQLLVWDTGDLPFAREIGIEGTGPHDRHAQLLLDGQQRLTSLAAVMLKRPLIVRDLKRPIDVAFNIYTEKFEVVGPRQAGDAGWISLADFFTRGAMATFANLKLDPNGAETPKIYEHLKSLDDIRQYPYHISVLTEMNYEEVTHIFVRINSGGTKLGGADLALAQISSRWHGVTHELKSYQDSVWRQGHKLWFDIGTLVRAIAVMLTGQSRPSQLFRGDRQNVTVEDLQQAWTRVKNGMDQALQFLIHNCKIERFDLMPTQYILLPLSAYFDRFGDHLTNEQVHELQRWVYMALIWSRYSSAAESAVDQDVNALNSQQSLRALIQNIEDKVGRRPVSERELRDQRKNSPYMLMAYVLARQAEAQDWFNGVVIGSTQSLELHHIFPKDTLKERYNLKADSRTIDQVANLAFLSGRANARIQAHPPSEYLASIDPIRLKAQSVPVDVGLWTVDRFEDFLLARRTLLADAINHLLQSLTEGPALWTVSEVEVLKTRVEVLERQLRSLTSRRLVEAWGEYAWDRGIPSNIRGNLDQRIKNHIANAPYEAKKYESLEGKLEACQFSDYVKIMKESPKLFNDVFGDLGRLEQSMKAVTAARNAFAHNNELSRAELALAEAGLLWIEDCLRVVPEANDGEDSNRDDSPQHRYDQ